MIPDDLRVLLDRVEAAQRTMEDHYLPKRYRNRELRSHWARAMDSLQQLNLTVIRCIAKANEKAEP